ncbi:putative glycosyltransferase [Mesoflavibacter sabulilitoris]|uniref:Glycosyltransferase n=1 Tax=Mesoflavibacter zeaxanthinifaciens subsp. sabulilitoris TaxID=1520893 RepID=A0A2T1N799_9FLAO|nr:glycosyltransferase [Mesoflavibacter zeaxanthinifaciens]MBB3124090.1 putative glycosyltransferase [Mesoflavibacter zeaxanthinifaciens subsp. sabulilitoris]PSG87744.1 glycosyltransferase [Mesoflavibacter zeaxanthinifaciens subsp. sabulilitoris]
MKKRILVAPLNWGIGHATRCIPIINALIEQNFEPVIASDGAALALLKKEFKQVIFIELPAYNVTYSKSKSSFKWRLFRQLPKIKKAILKEHLAIKKIVHDYAIEGIISDNRMGVYCSKIPSVFITHQLNVLSGMTTKLSTSLHDYYLKKFDECWVPDFENTPNLSGKLGHDFTTKLLPIKYIGALSRLEKTLIPSKFDIMVLLSGPEPQRGLLEQKLFKELADYNGNILFIKGKIEGEQRIETKQQFTIYNFMTSADLQTALNSCDLVISRSGYTTVMDLAKLGKKAFFIPTPGQFEQEYIAQNLNKQGIIPSCNQKEFSLKQLDRVKDFTGFDALDCKTNFSDLFKLFLA